MPVRCSAIRDPKLFSVPPQRRRRRRRGWATRRKSTLQRSRWSRETRGAKPVIITPPSNVSRGERPKKKEIHACFMKRKRLTLHGNDPSKKVTGRGSGVSGSHRITGRFRQPARTHQGARQKNGGDPRGLKGRPKRRANALGQGAEAARPASGREDSKATPSTI